MSRSRHTIGTAKTLNGWDPINKNLFQSDNKIGVDQSTNSISIRCPHCRQLGTFQKPLAFSLLISKDSLQPSSGHKSTRPYYASLYSCPNPACNGVVFAISNDEKQVLEIAPPEVIDFDPAGLPSAMLKTLTEAIDCHACGAHRAAAMMVRRLLEEICEENGATAANLHDRLEILKKKVTLPQELFDAMKELRLLGNDAAHIKAKSYDSIGTDEVGDCIELAKEILKSLYQLKGLVARLQARKAPA